MTKEQLENRVKELESNTTSMKTELEAFRGREKTQKQQENSIDNEYQNTINRLKLQLSQIDEYKDRVKELEAVVNNQATELEAFRGRERLQEKEIHDKSTDAEKLSERLKSQLKLDAEAYEKRIKLLETDIVKYKESEVNAQTTIKKIIEDANEKIQIAFKGAQSLNTLIVASFKNFQGALDNATDLYAFISKKINSTNKLEGKGE